MIPRNHLNRSWLGVSFMSVLVACGGGQDGTNGTGVSAQPPLQFSSDTTVSVLEHTRDSFYQAVVNRTGASYRLETGQDSGLFQLTNSGALAFRDAPDFEAPQDANGDNRYQVTIIATRQDGDSVSQTVTISVEDALAAVSAKVNFPSPNVNFAGGIEQVQVSGVVLDANNRPTTDTLAELTINGVAVSFDESNPSQWQASVPMTGTQTQINFAYRNQAGDSDTQSFAVFNEFSPEYNELVLDTANNLGFFIDQSLDTVYAVDLATGALSVVSGHTRGTGLSLVELSTAIAFDPSQGLYVHDRLHDGVINIDPATGDRRLIAASPSRGTPVGSGPAIRTVSDMQFDSSSGRLLLLAFDQGLSLLALDTNTGNRTSLVDDYDAGFNVVVEGNVAYAIETDTSTNTISAVEFDLSTGVSSVISSPDQGTGPALPVSFDLDLDAQAEQLILASDQNQVVKIDLASGDRELVQLSPAQPETNSELRALSVGANNTAFVYHRGLNQLLQLDLNSGAINAVSSPQRVNQGPSHTAVQQLALDLSRNRLLALESNRIIAIPLAAEQPRQNISPSNNTMQFTDSVFDAATGNIYRLNTQRNQIWVSNLAAANGTAYTALNDPLQQPVFTEQAPTLSGGTGTLNHVFAGASDIPGDALLSLQLDKPNNRLLALATNGILAFDLSTGQVSGVIAFGSGDRRFGTDSQWLALDGQWLVFDSAQALSFNQQSFASTSLPAAAQSLLVDRRPNRAIASDGDRLVVVVGTLASTLTTNGGTTTINNDGSIDRVIELTSVSSSQREIVEGDTRQLNIPFEQVRDAVLAGTDDVLYVAENENIIALSLQTGQRAIISR